MDRNKNEHRGSSVALARFMPKVYESLRGRVFSRMAIQAIMTAMPSLKLCSASDSTDRLPETSPPMTSAMEIRKFSATTIASRLPDSGAACEWSCDMALL